MSASTGETRDVSIRYIIRYAAGFVKRVVNESGWRGLEIRLLGEFPQWRFRVGTTPTSGKPQSWDHVTGRYAGYVFKATYRQVTFG